MAGCIMKGFTYRGSELYCEETALSVIAEDVGTPFYVYSRRRMEGNFDRVEKAMAGTDHLICYALKANANPHLLRLLSNKGCGADVVSGGEMRIALASGIPADRIVFAGVGKTDTEISLAVEEEILSIHVESMEELRIVDAIASELGKTARISIRVNPDVDPKTHPYIATGLKESKFGIPMKLALQAYIEADSLPGLEVHGVHCHLGSMIMEVEPYVQSAQSFVELIASLASKGIRISDVDIGGGLGVDYHHIVKENADDGAAILSPEVLFSRVRPILKPVDARIVFEPGRYIIADAGALVMRVTVMKEGVNRKFAVVDAGMNDLLRPSLYDAYHQIIPLYRAEGDRESVHIVGPICESGDFFSHEREMQMLRRRDMLAVMAAGAYGYTLASNYNGRPKAPEILVDGNTYSVIRRREQVQDLLGGTDVSL